MLSRDADAGSAACLAVRHMISTESTSNNLNWSRLEGTTLEGGYQLAELLQADETAATFRVRVLGDFRRKALANFYDTTGAAADEQVALWKSARAIRHPNLRVPLAAGRLPIEGAAPVYVVLDKPDESLSGVLSKRALAHEEADEILASLRKALEELHPRGFVHGCVSPDELFAFGETIKLSTDCIRKLDSAPPVELRRAKYLAPESAKENVTPAADVWCTGATLLEALTQKTCAGSDCLEQAESVAEPFKRVIRKFLEPNPAQRAKLADLESLRTGKVVQEVAAAATPAFAMAQPLADSTAAEQELNRIDRRRSFEPAQRSFQRSRTWVYAAVVLIVVIWLLWAERPKHPVNDTPAAQPVTTARAHRAGPAGSGTAWPTRTLSPDGSATTPRADVHPDARIAAPPKAAIPRSGDPAVWRVVLYTFSREGDAQKRAQAINEKHPGLDAQTFAPARTHMYLVVAGGKMTRSEAARLRLKALRQGMPRDTYIQNYKE